MTGTATPATGASLLLSVHDLAASHGGQVVFEGVNVTLSRGEIGSLLGPSGTGKTTLLRVIAGLHAAHAGKVMLRGVEATHAKPEARGLGFVFQDLALFPHLTVAGNLGFGLSRWPKLEREARIVELLERIGLAGLGSRLPHELSGGQQQRIALARSLAPRPDLLLLDEPFSGLDADLRPKLRDDLRRLLRAEQTAALLVTHDQQEAFAFADTVGVMLDGRLAQWASGETLYHRPASAAVARFVGEGRLLPVRGLGAGKIQSPFGVLEAGRGAPETDEDATGWLLVRPDDLVLGEGNTEATVHDAVFQGAETMHRLRLDDGTELHALAPSHRQFDLGARVNIRTDFVHVVLFPR